MIADNEQDLSERYEISYEKKNTNLLINLTGEFGLKNLKLFTNEIKKSIRNQNPDTITIDFSGISYIDSAAALAIIQIQKDAAGKKINCFLINLNDETKGIFSVIHGQALDQVPFKTKKFKDNFLIQIGQASLDIASDIVNFVTFVGELLSAIVYTIFHPKSLRVKDILFYMQRAGVDGLPIVGLISLLIGLIIAFMSFLQFRQIGANIYVPSLVSFAMVKELGPIVTADTLLRDMQARGLFRAVFSRYTVEETRFLLQGGINDFFLRIRENGKVAVISMEITLKDSLRQEATKRIVFQKKYSREELLNDQSPHGYYQAMSKALKNLSQQITTDVYEAIKTSAN